MQGIMRGEGEMRLDQFEKLFHFIQAVSYFTKNYPACVQPVTGVTGRMLFNTNRAFRSGQGR